MNLFKLNCPYCNYVLPFVPKRVKVCPNCKNKVYAINKYYPDKLDTFTVLGTEEDIKKHRFEKEKTARKQYREKIKGLIDKLNFIQKIIFISDQTNIVIDINSTEFEESLNQEELIQLEHELVSLGFDTLNFFNGKKNEFEKMLALEKKESEIVRDLNILKANYEYYCNIFSKEYI